jgi:uncharacterized membrane protein YgdD (TMEM256/DUF423 family)
MDSLSNFAASFPVGGLFLLAAFGLLVVGAWALKAVSQKRAKSPGPNP